MRSATNVASALASGAAPGETAVSMLLRDVERAAAQALQELNRDGTQLRFVTATEEAGVFRIGLWSGGIGPNLSVEIPPAATMKQAVDIVTEAITSALPD